MMKGLERLQDAPVEIYRPRPVEYRGLWQAGNMRFKVYDLLAEGQGITEAQIATARRFLETEVLDRVTQMGKSNGLGFVILHPGDLGFTIAAQWWAQGSVLCQHIYRKAYDEAAPMDTVQRPVVGCVWELAIIEAEQHAWRTTMMQPAPDPDGYLAAHIAAEAV